MGAEGKEGTPGPIRSPAQEMGTPSPMDVDGGSRQCIVADRRCESRRYQPSSRDRGCIVPPHRSYSLSEASGPSFPPIAGLRFA